MNLKLTREFKTERYTQGRLDINDEFFCWTMEDTERVLSGDCREKVPRETCIPKGIYTVILSFSNRFQKYMPEVLNVPCFSGIRIHSGNSEVDTDGCVLVGVEKTTSKVLQSKMAFVALMKRLKSVEKKEKIILEVI